MVMTLNVANESNKDFTYHGCDRYFLSQGRTVQSANRNMYNHLRKEYKYFEYETNVCHPDLMELLYTQFSPQWCEGECWADLFPEFTFIRSDRAGIMEIPQEMYDKIIEHLAEREEEKTHQQI